MTDSGDGFLARWSQRKAGARSGAPDAAAPPPVAPAAILGTPMEPQAPADRAPLPTMDDVARLTHGSDYSRFVGSAVDPCVSNAAMKRLFSDPHYNVMDGLDTYIDDYGKPDPIPLSVVRQMRQSKMLGLFAADEATAAPALLTEGEGSPPVPLLCDPPCDPAPPAGNHPPSPDDDADLRLQQDDAARRPGADSAARG